MFEAWKNRIRDKAFRDTSITWEMGQLGVHLFIGTGYRRVDKGFISARDLVRTLRDYGHLPRSQSVTTKSTTSCWVILGMMPTKDQDKIKAAYKRMALVYHPDTGGNDAAFRSLNRAFERAKELAAR